MPFEDQRSISLAQPDEMIFILVDVQQYFVDSAGTEVNSVLSRIKQMLLMADVLEVPVIATFEEPIERKGMLPDDMTPLFERLHNAQSFPKLTYDLTATESIRSAIAGLQKTQCAVVGTETDVCVLQSVFGLLRMGLEVFVVEDCLLSSSPNIRPALKRMYGSGAIPTTWKSLYYELVKTDDFDNSLRDNSALIRDGYVPPENL